MANSGNFSTNAYDSRAVTFNWNVASQSIDKNQTVINWNIKGSGGATNFWYMAGNFKVVIEGKTVYSSSTRIQLYNGTTVASGQFTISHNGDGSKRFSASVEAGIYYYDVNCRGNGSWDLPTIARATVPSVNKTTLSFGESLIISCPRASSSFTHTIQAGVDGKLNFTNIATNVATSYTWTVPKSYAKYLTNSSQRLRIKVITYSGSTKIGEKETSQVSVKATADMAPVVTITLSDPMNNQSKYGGFVKGKSKIKAKVSEKLYEGTSVVSRSLVLNSVTYQEAEQTSEVISSTNQQVKAQVTDARGMSGQATVTPVVYDWFVPRIFNFKVNRCKENGTLDEMGAYARVDYNVSIASVNNKNTKSLRIGYKQQNSSSWQYETIPMSSYALSGNKVFSISTEYTWDFCIELKDAFTTTSLTNRVGTAYVLMDFHKSGKGLAIGKVAESERVLDIASNWDVKLKDNVLSDFVIENGSNNIWIWRKWNSGLMEMWAQKRITATVGNTWGNYFTSGGLSESRLNYPFSFVEMPVVIVTVSPNTVGAQLMVPGGTNYAGTLTNTGVFEIARGTKITNAVFVLNYYVTGKWK